MDEPKKETVRIALPQRPETTQGLQNDGAKHEAARILLPSRTPAIPPRRSAPTITPTSPVNTGTPIISSHRPPVLPPNVAASPVLHALPKPSPAPAPAVNTKKTQPPITRPAAATVQPAPVIVATSGAIDAFDSIPRWFCWGLLGISALIFLIQIWNYALS